MAWSRAWGVVGACRQVRGGVKLLEPERESPNCAGGAGEQEWCRWSGVVVLHIHPGVLVGVVAWFQRFLGPGDVRGRDECAMRASLHIHPGSRPRVVRRIRVITPFTDRGL